MPNPKIRKTKEIDKLTARLKKAIRSYLDLRVIEPALQTVDHEFTVQKDIVVILCIFEVVENLVLHHGASLDKDSFASLFPDELKQTMNILNSFLTSDEQTSFLPAVENIFDKHLNKKHLFAYLKREIQWISVSLLAASYISTLILIRSIFELLIGLSTKVNGSMTARIDSIAFFTENEKQLIKKSWNYLNGWAHPYGKWEKEVCPIFISHKPLYHPALYKDCINQMRLLADIMLLVAINKYGIEPNQIGQSLNKINIDPTEMENFTFFKRRLQNFNDQTGA